MCLRKIEKLRFCVREGLVICTRGNGRHNPSVEADEFCRVVKLPINTPYTTPKKKTRQNAPTEKKHQSRYISI
jgi:hypothetical protein